MYANIPKEFEYLPWNDNTEFLAELRKLPHVDVKDVTEMRDAVRALKRLFATLTQMLDQILHLDEVLDQDAIRNVMNIYRESIDNICRHEGRDFRLRSAALWTCLRLIQFVFGLAYDAWE